MRNKRRQDFTAKLILLSADTWVVLVVRLMDVASGGMVGKSEVSVIAGLWGMEKSTQETPICPAFQLPLWLLTVTPRTRCG